MPPEPVFVDWNVDLSDDGDVAAVIAEAVGDVMTNERQAALVENTPKFDAPEDGDQPPEPAAWNDDGDAG